jgi:hypothetical protein
MTPSPSAGLGPPTARMSSPSGPASKARTTLGRHAHDVPLTQVVDVAVEEYPSGSGDDDVRLLLLAVTVRHRAAQIGRVAEEADPQVARIEVFTSETPLDPGRALAHRIFDFQQVYDGEA